MIGSWIHPPFSGNVLMLFGFFGRVTAAPQLREALDASAARTRGIAQRVSAASVGGASGFSLPQGEGGSPVDLEAEMTALADEQLRYDATAKLLERTYSRLRLTVRDR